MAIVRASNKHTCAMELYVQRNSIGFNKLLFKLKFPEFFQSRSPLPIPQPRNAQYSFMALTIFSSSIGLPLGGPAFSSSWCSLCGNFSFTRVNPAMTLKIRCSLKIKNSDCQEEYFKYYNFNNDRHIIV